MTDDTIIAEWPLNSRTRARVSIEHFKGTPLISVRKWFEAEDGSVRPARQGIALGLRHLPALASGVGKALAVARDRGLIAADMPDGTSDEK